MRAIDVNKLADWRKEVSIKAKKYDYEIFEFGSKKPSQSYKASRWERQKKAERAYFTLVEGRGLLSKKYIKSLEFIVALNAHFAYFYILNRIYVIGDRLDKGVFEALKKEIAKSPEYSFYFSVLLKDRFLEGEDAISSSASLSLRYASKYMQGRFKKGERAIALDYDCAELYTNYLREDFVLEGELICSYRDSF